MEAEPRLSFQKKCALLNVKRSAMYYRMRHSKQKEKEQEDVRMKDEIDAIQLEFPYYGYRMVTKELKRRGLDFNKKKIQRVMQKYGLMSQIRKLFKSFTQSRHKLPKYPNLIHGRTATAINQIWGADITYVRVKNGFVYVAVIIDFYSRNIRGWAISKSLDHRLPLHALTHALAYHPPPKIHHSDQGAQYCSIAYTDTLKERKVHISMADKGNPFQNSITESFFKTLKYNEVYLNEYESFEEAQSNIKRFIEIVYQKKRLHSSLNYMTPEEFENRHVQISKVAA